MFNLSVICFVTAIRKEHTMGFEEISLRDSLPSIYLDRYEPAKGRKDVAFICTPRKWRTDIHYSEALGVTFHCFDGICCDVVPQKSSYTIYLIAQYVDYNNPKSKLVLKYLKAGRQVDEQIRALVDQFEDDKGITKLDLTLTLDTSKSEKFKMVKITPILNNTRKASKEALQDLKEQLKTFMPNLQQSIATVYTEEQFKALCEEKGVYISGDYQAIEKAPSTGKTSTKKAPAKEVAPVEEEPEDVLFTEDSTEDETVEQEPSTEVEDVEFDLDSLLDD